MINSKFVLVLLVFIVNCKSKSEYKLTNSKIMFSSIFGIDSSDSSQIYCLLDNGFFYSKIDDKIIDNFISNWIITHKKYQTIPILSIKDTNYYRNKTMFTYCLVIAEGDTLNLELIKKGFYPSSVMHVESNVLQDSFKSQSLLFHMKKESYYDYYLKTINAEIVAKKNKVGIWQ